MRSEHGEKGTDGCEQYPCEGDVIVEGHVWAARRIAALRRRGWPVRVSLRGTAAPAEHLQLVHDNLGAVAVVSVAVLPLAGAQPSLHVNRRAFAQVLTGDFGEPAEEGETVPLRALLLFAGVLVPPLFIGGETQIRDALARRHRAYLRVLAEVADQDDFVHAAHGRTPSKKWVPFKGSALAGPLHGRR